MKRRIAIMAAVVAALGLGRVSAPGPVEPEPRAVEAPTASAVGAATAYLRALRWDVLVNDVRRRSVLAEHATASAVEQLDMQLGVAAQGVRAAAAHPPVVGRGVIIGCRVEALAIDRASVSIWGLALFGSGEYQPAAQWSTSRMELVRRGRQWLVADVETTEGPSPASTIDELASADEEFGGACDAA